MKSINFDKTPPASLYYMKQTISNACGTVAMLHSVANNLDSIPLESGILKDFLDSTKDSSPEERAKKLEDDENVVKVHDDIAKKGQTAVSIFYTIESLYKREARAKVILNVALKSITQNLFGKYLRN